jgi:hypothetical protein
MALQGDAALAMWWDMAAAARADFEHWHAHEHFAERLALPGFRRASRWRAADGGEGVFVLYELANYEVLCSPMYLARLNAPTPWSTRLMPHHRGMVRSQCMVLESRGVATGAYALTVRLSPALGRDDELRAGLRALADSLVQRPGLVGLHVLRHATPLIAQTEEQRMRGLSDRVADWVLVATGYERSAVEALAGAEFSDAALAAWGAQPGAERGVYALAHTATPADMV